MELVYLWVKGYKNIKEKGFNFSSKFICHYDEDKNELTIDDNPEHIPDFFGKNINVTAIVGKNGSGKSSVLFQDKNGREGWSPNIKILYINNVLHILEPYKSYWDDDGPYINLISIKNNTHIKYMKESKYNHFDLNDRENKKQYFISGPIPESIDDEYSIYFDWDVLKYSFIDEYEEIDYYGTTRPRQNILLPLISENSECISYKKFSERIAKKVYEFKKYSFHEDFFALFAFKTEKTDLLNLSHGERSLFVLTFLLFEEYYRNAKDLIIYVDEPDLMLHPPSWQKELVSLLLKMFSFSNKKFHLIFTTHSPFLLSDIPKQNIIFLDIYNEKDDEVKNAEQKIGNCKVVDGLKEKKQTFGANIHTLLSDSFFMDNGLMGEFAKGKINEIINFHKEVEEENKKEVSNLVPLKTKYEEKNKIKFWQTQSIIGEEYLKQVIKNHLRDIENILLGHNEAKQEEIKRLRDEADRLENM